MQNGSGQFKLTLFRGRYAIYWREGGQPKRHSLGTDDPLVAERRFQEFLRQQARPETPTVEGFWHAYCEDMEGRRVLRAMASEWKSLGPVFGHLSPDQITVQMCRDYAAKRYAKGIKPGTVWTELGHLRTVLQWAAKRGYIDRAPHIELPMKPPPKERYLTRKEAERLIDGCGMPHVRLFVILMLSTAARPEAARELTWDRVDFERGLVHLNLFTGQRRKGRATVPMNNTLRAALADAYKARTCQAVIEYAGHPVGDMKRGFKAAVARAKLDNVTPHTLRHTAAVWMAEGGVPMAQIAQYLGHEDSRITERVYAKFSPAYQANAASVLELRNDPVAVA